MKRIIAHVNSKPDHIRHFVAIGCTVVVGSLVFAFWFNSFQDKTYALLNPEDVSAAESRTFADSGSGSLFSTMADTFLGLKAQIGSLFDGNSEVNVQQQTENQNQEPVHPLPISN